MRDDHIEDLKGQARYAHERHQLYRAKAMGERPTSPERLRELQRADEQAAERLRFAQSEALRPDPPDG
jgi:hypothetical protein